MIKLPVQYDSLSGSQRWLVRKMYTAQQHGLCLHCKSDLDKPPPHSITRKKINWKLFPKDFLKYPVHLHHDHKTGLTKGTVHAYCNAVLWQYHGE